MITSVEGAGSPGAAEPPGGTGSPVAAAARTLRRDAAENRARLLRAAAEVLAEHGGDASVDEIARRAGVGMGTLYRRFPTKDDLIAALADEMKSAMLERVMRIADEESDGDALAACLWTMAADMAPRRGYLKLLWPALTAGGDQRRVRLWRVIDDLLARAQRAGTVRADLTLTDVYLCTISLRALMDETADPDPDMWRRYLELLLAAFRPSSTPLGYPPADDSLIEKRIQAPLYDPGSPRDTVDERATRQPGA